MMALTLVGDTTAIVVGAEPGADQPRDDLAHNLGQASLSFAAAPWNWRAFVLKH